MRAGEILVSAGTRLEAQHIGAISAAGYAEVPVYKQPVIGILSTGDELIAPGEIWRPGCVYDSNTYTVSAIARQYGMQVFDAGRISDEKEMLRDALREMMETCDIVVVSGGSSQGEKDYTARCFDEVSNHGVFTHGLALKPGKPTILGYDEKTSTLLAGLPGHPVAAMLVFHLLICGSLDQIWNRRQEISIPAVLSENYGCDPGKANCITVSLSLGPNGWTAKPIRGKSGLLTSLSASDGYILTDHNCEGIQAGETVFVHLLKHLLG